MGLTEGELFSFEEGPMKDEDSGVERVKATLNKDGKVGWVTIKGNAGTVYAERSDKHYKILSDTLLLKRQKGDDEEAATILKAGTIIQTFEAPKEETVDPEVRVYGRVLGDGELGWMALNNNVKLWRPTYKCVLPSPMQESRDPTGATTVREIKIHELVDIIEGPFPVGKMTRIKCRADKDGKTGWMTVRNAEGKYFLKCD